MPGRTGGALNRLGKGRVLTISASPDFATAGEHPIVEARKLLARAVWALNPHPRLRIEAPAFVETVARDETAARRLHVHFIAYLPTPTTTPASNRPYVIPGLIEDSPCYRIRVQLQGAPRGAKAWSKETRVEIKQNTVEALINDIHEVVTIDY